MRVGAGERFHKEIGLILSLVGIDFEEVKMIRHLSHVVSKMLC